MTLRRVLAVFPRTGAAPVADMFTGSRVAIDGLPKSEFSIVAQRDQMSTGSGAACFLILRLERAPRSLAKCPGRRETRGAARR